MFRIVQKIAGLLFFSVAIQLCACSEKPETPKKVMVEPIYQSYEIPLPPKDCQTEEQETVDTIQSTLSSEVINKVSEWEQKFPKSLLTNAIIVKQFDELKDDSEEHLARIQKLEMICPKWAFPKLMRGNYFFKKQDYAQARTSLEKALTLKPDYPTAQFNFALVAMKQKDFQQVIQNLDSLLSSNKNHPNALLLRAQAHLALENWDLAEQDVKQANLNNPKDGKPYLLLWQLYSKTGKMDLANKAGCTLKELGDPIGNKICKEE